MSSGPQVGRNSEASGSSASIRSDNRRGLVLRRNLAAARFASTSIGIQLYDRPVPPCRLISSSARRCRCSSSQCNSSWLVCSSSCRIKPATPSGVLPVHTMTRRSSRIGVLFNHLSALLNSSSPGTSSMTSSARHDCASAPRTGGLPSLQYRAASPRASPASSIAACHARTRSSAGDGGYASTAANGGRSPMGDARCFRTGGSAGCEGRQCAYAARIWRTAKSEKRTSPGSDTAGTRDASSFEWR